MSIAVGYNLAKIIGLKAFGSSKSEFNLSSPVTEVSLPKEDIVINSSIPPAESHLDNEHMGTRYITFKANLLCHN